MIFVAAVISQVMPADVEDVLAIGGTRQEAVDLVMDAWHDAAQLYRLDPDSVHPEDVAVWAGEVGQSFVNREPTR